MSAAGGRVRPCRSRDPSRSEGRRRWRLLALALPAVIGSCAAGGPRASERVDLAGASAGASTAGDVEALERLYRIQESIDRGRAGRPDVLAALADADPALRRLALVGLRRLAAPGDDTAAMALPLLADPSPSVRLEAASALCAAGRSDAGLPVLLRELEHGSPPQRLHAADALAQLDDEARPAIDALRGALDDENEYVVRLAQRLVRRFEGEPR